MDGHHRPFRSGGDAGRGVVPPQGDDGEKWDGHGSLPLRQGALPAEELTIKEEAREARHRLRDGEGQPEGVEPQKGQRPAQGHEERHRPQDRQERALPGVAHGLEENRKDEARDKGQEAEADPAEAVAADGDHQLVPGEEAEHGPRQKLKAEETQEHQSKAQEEGDF